MSSYGLDIQVRFPAYVRIIFLFAIVPKIILIPTQSPIQSRVPSLWRRGGGDCSTLRVNLTPHLQLYFRGYEYVEFYFYTSSTPLEYGT
jgi:hypothetical protein